MNRVKDKLGDKEVYIMMLEEHIENLQIEIQQLKENKVINPVE